MQAHPLIMIMHIIKEVNSFVVLHARESGLINTWKTSNKVDRSSLLDIDERVVVMKNKLMSMSMVIVRELIQGLKLKGLTTGPN